MIISGLISGVTISITHIRGLLTPLITAHEPPTLVRMIWPDDSQKVPAPTEGLETPVAKDFATSHRGLNI